MLYNNININDKLPRNLYFSTDYTDLFVKSSQIKHHYIKAPKNKVQLKLVKIARDDQVTGWKAKRGLIASVGWSALVRPHNSSLQWIWNFIFIRINLQHQSVHAERKKNEGNYGNESNIKRWVKIVPMLIYQAQQTRNCINISLYRSVRGIEECYRSVACLEICSGLRPPNLYSNLVVKISWSGDFKTRRIKHAIWRPRKLQ